MKKKIIYCILASVCFSLLTTAEQAFMPSMLGDIKDKILLEQVEKTPPVKSEKKKSKTRTNVTDEVATMSKPNDTVLAQELTSDGDTTITAVKDTAVAVDGAEEEQEEKYMKIVRRLEKMDGWINNFNSASHRGIYGYIRGIYYGDGKIFLLTTLQNTTNIDYEIESIAFISNSIRTSKKQIAPDEVIYTPIWQTELSVIQRQSSVKAIFVFEKFFIAENKNVLMSIYENDGERNVTLKIIPDYFMNAKYIR